MANNLDFNKTRYTHRDYESLKKDLISAIPSLTQKWTSTEDSDPGIVLIKLISMLGDNLSYNMDKMALEMYLDSVTQRKNCRKILSLLGYKMHWYRSAKVKATVRNMLTAGSSADAGVVITLTPWESIFKSGSLQYVYVSEENKNTEVLSLIPLGNSKEITLVEGTVNTARFSGSSLQNNRYYFTKKNIDEAHIRLLYDSGINGMPVENSKLVDNLYLVGDNDTLYFEFGVDEYDTPYIELIDFWKSFAGENANFTVQYIVTSGSDGNISDNAFDLVQYDNGSCLYVSNLANNTETSAEPYNTPGEDPQTPTTARKESADWVFTYDTLVSEFDFEKAARRENGIYNSKLVDGEIIKLDGLDLEELLNRKDDDTEFSSYIVEDTSTTPHTYSMKSYMAILYLIHQDFTDNTYGNDDTWFDDPDNMVNEYVFDYDAGTGGYTGQKFFQYKPIEDLLDKVEISLRDNKIINVELHYGTTKVFPFLVDGTLHFIEPLDPATMIYIVDTLIPDALKLYFRPDNREYGVKPNFIEIVDVIQNADSRIKYFDAESSLIDWIVPIGQTDAPVFDSTSFAKYQGLASTFNIDPKFMKFTITNTTDSNISLSAPTDESSIDPRQGYEDITIDDDPLSGVVTILAGQTMTVTCYDIPQVRTLNYWINTTSIAYNS